MELTIHCPSCRVRIIVPSHIAGRSGRCRKCGERFRVPEPDAVGEETITDWLGGDGEAEEEEIPAAPPESVGPRAPERFSSGSDPGGADGDGDGAADGSAEDHSARRGSSERHADPPPREEGEPGRDGAERGDGSRDRRGRTVYRVRSAIPAAPKPPDPEEERYRRASREELRERIAERREREAAAERAAAEQTAADRADEGEPIRLDVLDAQPGSVRLAFAPSLLGRPAFRMSMPFYCLSCGEGDPERLYARPLIWTDMVRGGEGAAKQPNNSRDLRVGERRSVREVVRSMQPIEELPPPCNEPMPCFVCERCARRVTVFCQLVNTSGGTRCEVLVPSGSYALAWLGRVSGVCGDDYLRLESDLLGHDDSAWSELDEKVRERLGAWFRFEGEERFILYVSDSDFMKADAGLAGIVLTDHRLVYCRYHHQGAIPLDAGGALRTAGDGPFRELFYHHDGHRRKLVRLRTKVWDALAEQLDELQTPLRPAAG